MSETGRLGPRKNTEPQSFAALLRHYRVAAGLSQQALAEQAGVSERGLSDLERGARRLPYRDTVQRLAQALDLTPDERAALLAASSRVKAAPVLEHCAETKPRLPLSLTSFVGRTNELAEVRRLLETTRLLTLTGAGGIGKTRLALEVSSGLAKAYREGVVLAEFAALAKPSLVPQAAASALNVQEQPGRPLWQTLIDALQSRQLLLVFDNCEHLVQACAELAEMLLKACPGVRILATSRQPLGIRGEVAWRVPSLSVPSPAHLVSVVELRQAGAAQLFIDRVQAALPSFAATDKNAIAVAQICQRLDGIPLALELAAARVPMLGIDQLTARLDDCFRLLTGGSRTALPRQQTLRGALDWSCSLLSSLERCLFRRLSVFAGGWSLEAAETACVGGEIQHADVLELLVQLVDKSLVAAEERDGQQRYRLLEPIRQYAMQQLELSGDAEAVRRQHAEYFTALAESAEPQLTGAAQAEWLNRLECERDNMRAALAWSLEPFGAHPEEQMYCLGLRAAAALCMPWHIRGHWREGRQWLETALARATGASGLLRAKALNAAGWLAWDQGDYERAEALSEEALQLSRELRDPWSIAWSSGRLSHVRWMQAHYADATELATEALTLFRQIGAPWYIGWSLHQLGRVAYAQGDEQRAADLFEQSLDQFQIAGDRGFGAAFQFANLGDVARVRGDYRRATQLYEEALIRLRELGFKQGLVHTLHSLAEVSRAQGAVRRAGVLHREALTLCRDLGDVPGIAVSLEGLAELAQSEGHLERTTRLLATAATLREVVGCPVPPTECRGRDQNLTALRTQLGEDVFESIWLARRATSLGDAVADALVESAGD